MQAKKQWWRGAAIYQIYPRSFYDANGDGIGDLKGITEKLDYVASLNVDAIWVSPFFQSPMKDFGYDVSDFRAIDPIFGTMDDFDEMIDKAHSLGLKLIMDLVLNHTADQHAWFQESSKCKNNEKADWYVWADPKPDGTPPNNWQSFFGGPAWSFHTGRGQYYLHNFLSSQPDINFHCDAVIEALFDTVRYWLDKGVDGFRLDTANFYTHDAQLRDNPPRDGELDKSFQYNGLWPYSMQKHIYDKTRPENLAFIERLRAVVEDYDDCFLLGEIGDDNPIQTAVEYTKGFDRLHSAYSFSLLGGFGEDISAESIAGPVKTELAADEKSWPTWAFSNHDVVRTATRWNKNNPNHNPDFAKMLNALLASLRGTFCLYQGEELGLTEAILQFDDLVDPWGIATWPEWQGRDGCRTPMPWNAHLPKAGFTTNPDQKPWLPVCQNHYPLAVLEQDVSPESPLNALRAFLSWRKNHPALITGDIDFIDAGSDIIAFKRFNAESEYQCFFNLKDSDQIIKIQDGWNIAYSSGVSLDSNKSGAVSLSGFGFVIFSSG